MTEQAQSTIPFKKGDWVFNGLQIAKVKEVWADGAAKDAVFHLFPYNAAGLSIGRWHDPMGGPRNFEPCCSMENWRRIEKPKFPINDRYGLTGKFVFLDSDPEL